MFLIPPPILVRIMVLLYNCFPHTSQANYFLKVTMIWPILDDFWLISVYLSTVLITQFVCDLTNYLLVSILWLKNATVCSETNFSNFHKNSSPSPIEVLKSLSSCIFSTVGVGFELQLVDSLFWEKNPIKQTNWFFIDWIS